MHPTVKPVALVAEAIKDCSRRGEIVLDPFAGSGTTLIAAHNAGRCARLIEFDPAYCDQIVRRFERVTGKQAILATTRQVFEVVAEERGSSLQPPTSEEHAMTDRPKKPSSGDNEVGYGKPPSRTRFRKGVSGNPGGRPRGMTAGRAKALALKEAYRLIAVREGERVLTMPAIQVVLRNQVALAAKGNGPAQRAILETVQAIERELAAQAIAEDKAEADKRPMSDIEIARRIAFALSKPLFESGQPPPSSQFVSGSPTGKDEDPVN